MPQSRFSYRVFSPLLLLALAVGVASAPLRLAAQSAEPTTNSETAAQSPTQPATPAAAPEKKTDEEQAEGFRLEGTIVKWTAKTFNLQANTAASIFEFFNFAIIVLGVGIPLVRVMPKVLRSRGEKVRIDIESARKMTEDANARLGAIEAKLNGLDGEIALIRAQVEAESRADEARIKATIGEESARIVAAAEQEIGVSAAQARRSLRHFAADLAIEQATRQLVLTPQTDQALIAEFLSDAALSGAAGNGKPKGGQN
jgi:F-type H+-transporting ATPase subunit b